MYMTMIIIIMSAGFLLEKKVGVNQPKRLENARVLIANTAMDTDKIKVFGSKVSEDGRIQSLHNLCSGGEANFMFINGYKI